MIGVCNAGVVAYETANGDKLTKSIDRRHRVACGERNDFVAIAQQERIGADHERACLQLCIAVEGGIDVVLSTGRENFKVQADRSGRVLGAFELACNIIEIGI